MARNETVDKALDLTRQLNPQGVYSQGAEAAAQLPQERGTLQQMGAMLQKRGVKPAEMANSGLDWNSSAAANKRDVAKAFQQNLPRVLETQLSAPDVAGSGDFYGGDPQYESYALPGGENYRELLLHAGPKKMTASSPEMDAAARAIDESSNRLNEYRRTHGEAVTGVPLAEDPEYRTLAEELQSRYAALKAAEQRHLASIQQDYHSSHWEGVPNVLAHLRVSDRYDPTSPEGDKMLHLDELQSDWGQEAREKGIKGQVDPKLKEAALRVANDVLLPNRKFMPGFAEKGVVTDDDLYRMKPEQIDFWEKTGAVSPEQAQRLKAYATMLDRAHNGVPHHPYIQNTNAWVDLGLKRALLEAAKNDHTRLAWTPGHEHADRYGLEKHFKALEYSPQYGNLFGIDHRNMQRQFKVAPEELPAHVGSEVAKKLLAAPQNEYGRHVLNDIDLRIGGEGMKAFYDRLVPQRLAEIIKKLGHKAEFEPVTIKHGKKPYHKEGEPVRPEDIQTTLHSIKLTPELKESVLKGMPAFKAGGDVLARANGGHVTLRAAGVMLHDPEDRVLFVKRAHKAGDHGGKWAFPGGKIEHKETPEGAAIRETHEEIGHHIGSKLGEPVDHRVSKDGVEFTTFKHRVPKQFTPKLNEEHTDHVWAHPNSAPEPLHPGVKLTLDKLMSKNTMDRALRLTARPAKERTVSGS